MQISSIDSINVLVLSDSRHFVEARVFYLYYLLIFYLAGIAWLLFFFYYRLREPTLFVSYSILATSNMLKLCPWQIMFRLNIIMVFRD